LRRSRSLDLTGTPRFKDSILTLKRNARAMILKGQMGFHDEEHHATLTL
jgi:hypothetical protein